MTVTWGIVGLGGIANRMAVALRQANDAELVAVCSRDRAKAGEFAAQHGATKPYADYQEFLIDPRVDVVYISTPNAMHAPQTLAALNAGKHVLVEKPMALTVSDAEAMVERARAVKRILGVGFHLRHHPVHRQIKHLVDSGELGDLIFAASLWGSYSPGLAKQRERWQMQPDQAGAGSIMGLGVHEIRVNPSDRTTENPQSLVG
jgi:predicted dehydrogenase